MARAYPRQAVALALRPDDAPAGSTKVVDLQLLRQIGHLGQRLAVEPDAGADDAAPDGAGVDLGRDRHLARGAHQQERHDREEPQAGRRSRQVRSCGR